MKTLTITAVFQARPSKEAELHNALLELVAPTRKETGCINYDLHAASDGAGKFLFHENWTSQAALDAHLKSAHIQSLLPRVDELCVAFPEIKTWEKIE